MDSEVPGPTGPGRTRRETLVRRISHGLAALAGALLLVLFLVNVLQIGARPLMGGWIWVNDLSRLLVTWVIMLGASAAVGLREHLIVDFVVERAPEKFRAVSAYFTRAAEIGIGFILLVSGVVVGMERMNIQYIQLGIPTGYAYLAVPAVGFFMVLFGLLMNIRPPESAPTVAAEGGDAR
ncbi:TRAP transporter small permease [Georgenia sp. MJ170]|uniref:TRAP transporter small permease n=1 Tax=Georgenia sunbinii TaxID=3117728 RepID=UPI002F26644A